MALAFDANYYLSTRPDVFNAFVKLAGASGQTWAQFAEAHYNSFGRFEGSNPNTTFNTNEYLAANPDVAAAGVNPFTHFLNFGAAEGRAPSASFPSFASFDEKAYLAANADLGAAGITTKGAAYAHFVKFGQFEGRPGAPAVDTGVPGQTFTLTEGVDDLAGTANNDTFKGLVGNQFSDPGKAGNVLLQKATFTGVDVINGGNGKDTLDVTIQDGAVTLNNTFNVKNVETVQVSSLGAATVDLTGGFEGTTALNVVKAAGAVNATAAATTDIGVSVKGVAGTTVTVNGGKDVTVTTTDAAAAIDVGATGADPAGVVTITATGATVENNATNATNVNTTMGDISVGGGKTVNVTQKAGAATNIVTDGGTETVVQGDVSVTANATTTDVTIKQDKAVTAASVAAVAGATEVASVKFEKLDTNESVTISGLTFKASKNLTAAEVAQAFANLAIDAAKPTQIDPAGTATGDTQGAGISANGTFTGSLLANWTSGAATGDTVVFTAKANTAITDLAPSAKATVTTTTQGVTAVEAKNTLGVEAGTVAIVGGAALKTVTVDGYAASANGVTGGTNTALDTINLSNGTDFAIASAATTLALNLANVNGTVDVAAGTKTLNAVVNGAATDISTLKSASVETVNVSGTGNVAGTTAAGGLTAATAINTSGMTGGKATFTIDNGTTTSYTGGAAVDSVTISNANVAITKAVDLGAGDDKLTLNVAASTVAVPTANLNGGAGTDTIAMNGESAASLSANGTFAGKIDGFEKLEITDKVTTSRTINMSNMDGIAYVVSNNSENVAAVATKTTFTATVQAGATANANDTVTFDGVTYTFTSTAANPTAFATALYGLILANPSANWVATGVSGAGITFEAANTGVTATPAAGDFAFADVDTSGDAATFATATGTAGAAAGAGVPSLTIDKMVNNGTLELVAAGDGVVVQMADASGSSDSFNIVTKVVGTSLNFGEVTVAGVESLKLTASDSQPTVSGAASIQTGTLELKADAATSLVIDGNSNLVLTLDAATNKLATINASALTGSLTAEANGAVAMTITGGSGADVLKASVGADAKADVINGGAGADAIYAGSNGAKLTGGDGNDIFVVTAAAANGGNKEANTYSEILDFKGGDLIQLQSFADLAVDATVDVAAFAKLTANLNDNTATFSNFVDAAILQAGVDGAVGFNFKGDAYIVVDSHANGATFVNGEDLVVKVTGINVDNLSFNSDYGTLALV